MKTEYQSRKLNIWLLLCLVVGCFDGKLRWKWNIQLLLCHYCRLFWRKWIFDCCCIFNAGCFGGNEYLIAVMPSLQVVLANVNIWLLLCLCYRLFWQIWIFDCCCAIVTGCFGKYEYLIAVVPSLQVVLANMNIWLLLFLRNRLFWQN